MAQSWALLAFCATALAISRPALADADYDRILAAQPPGLTVSLTLPKDHFYQGEVIPATLTYMYAGKDAYVAMLTPHDRSGRNQEVLFFATDEHGVPVDDPIGWLYLMGIDGGGMTGMTNLGTATMTQIPNQWLRFDHPGTYTLYATTTAVHGGTKDAMVYATQPELVTNKVTITITPLDPADEKVIIGDATQRIDDAYKSADAQDENSDHAGIYAVEPDIERLRFLETPAARAALRSRLDIPEYMIAGGHFQIACGLLGAPDRPAEALLILDDVKAGRLKVDSSLIELYTQLKTYPQFMDNNAWDRRNITPAEIPQRRAVDYAWEKSRKDAGKEILDAAMQASSKTGATNLDLIWAAFLANRFDPDYHAQAVAHQLDFSHDRQLQLLSMLEMSMSPHMLPGETNTSTDFLPLVRLYLGSPAYNKDALMILAYARPQEAHDITLADWASPVHHYFNLQGNMGELAVTLLEAPGMKWTDEQKDILDRMRRPH